MKKIAIIAITVLAAIVLFLVAGAFVLFKIDAKEYELLDKCRSLDPNVTESELMNIMGQPVGIAESEGRSFYYYPSPRLAAEPTYIIVGKGSNEILEIHCGEETRGKGR